MYLDMTAHAFRERKNCFASFQHGNLKRLIKLSSVSSWISNVSFCFSVLLAVSIEVSKDPIRGVFINCMYNKHGLGGQSPVAYKTRVAKPHAINQNRVLMTYNGQQLWFIVIYTSCRNFLVLYFAGQGTKQVGSSENQVEQIPPLEISRFMLIPQPFSKMPVLHASLESPVRAAFCSQMLGSSTNSQVICFS